MRDAMRASLFELEVALRYLRTARRDALVRLLSRIAGVGLGVGVAALILALAALSGFQERLLGAVRQSTPALQLELRPEHRVEDVRRAVAEVVPQHALQQVLVGRGWVGGGGRYEVAELVGYERRRPRWLGEALPAVSFGGEADGPADPDAGVWISQRLTGRIGLAPGEAVEIVSPRPHLGPRGPQPRARWLEVAGWLESPDVEEAFNERVALPLDVASTLLGAGDRRLDLLPEEVGLLGAAESRGGASWSAAARSDRRLSALAGELRVHLAEAGLESVRVLDWRDRNRPLLFVLRLEKAVVFLAVAVIVLMASFAVPSTLHLLLANKTREIGVFGALGTSPRRLRRIFRTLGLLLAGTGGVVGGLVGTALAWLLDRYELLRLPGQVYILDHVPFSVRATDAGLVILAALLLTFAATVLGARRVAALDVVEALRR